MKDAPQPDDPGDGLIILTRYDCVPDAELARGRLESEGIPAFVFDDNTVAAQWLYSLAMGGLRLLVRAKDAAKAVEILGLAPIEQAELVKEAGETVEIYCPKCGSKHVWRGSASGLARPWAIVAAFFMIMVSLAPPPPSLTRYRCKSCGHVWRVLKPRKMPIS